MLGVFVLGMIAFLPFHALKALGVADGAIVGAHAASCVVVFAAARGRASAAPNESVLVIAAIYALHVAVLGALWTQGTAPNAVAKLALFAGSAALLFAMAYAPLARQVRGAKVARSP